MPPAVVINGGCAQTGSNPSWWPETAVTFLLLGGRDYFRGGMPDGEYVAFTKGRVPAGSTTTAILFVREMEHMPQAPLLGAILRDAISAAISWRASGRVLVPGLRVLLSALSAGGWTGQLSYTSSSGAWEDIAFAGATPGKSLPAALSQAKNETKASAVGLVPVVDSCLSPKSVESPSSKEARKANLPGFVVGSRIEALYDDQWFAGIVRGLPADDPADQGRWAVQCDVDREGVLAYVVSVRMAGGDQTGFERQGVRGGLGSRVEALYEGRWCPGTIVGQQEDDPRGLGRWAVQCDEDSEGVRAFVQHIRPIAA